VAQKEVPKPLSRKKSIGWGGKMALTREKPREEPSSTHKNYSRAQAASPKKKSIGPQHREKRKGSGPGRRGGEDPCVKMLKRRPSRRCSGRDGRRTCENCFRKVKKKKKSLDLLEITRNGGQSFSRKGERQGKGYGLEFCKAEKEQGESRIGGGGGLKKRPERKNIDRDKHQQNRAGEILQNKIGKKLPKDIGVQENKTKTEGPSRKSSDEKAAKRPGEGGEAERKIKGEDGSELHYRVNNKH